MERFKHLNRYQKGVVFFMLAMIIVFAVIYYMTISREGFAYKNSILVPDYENGGIVYSGKIDGKQAEFTVSEDKTVYFRYDGKKYGPYTAKEDATAIPEDNEFDDMVGVELHCGEELIFRGGIFDHSGSIWLYNEQGDLENLREIVEASHGDTIMKEYDDEFDAMEPTASVILALMGEPKLTHKGEFSAWLVGVLVCILNTLYILFADEIFRFNASFLVRDVERAEPSEWGIAFRYIGSTLGTVLVMAIFIMGLRW